MRCKFCGGEINLSVSRCIRCGRTVDDTVDTRILHDFGALTEKYGLDPNESKYDPEQPADDIQPVDQRTFAAPLPPDLRTAKTPGIQLQTYYELLGNDESPESSELPVSESNTESSVTPVDEPESSPPVSYPPNTETALYDQNSSKSHDDTTTDHPEPDSDPYTVSEPAIDAGSDLRGKLMLILNKADALTAPVTERIREWISAKMPQMNRAQNSSKLERLAVMGILMASLVFLIVMIALIISSIPADIKGEWRISEENAHNVFTVEFSSGEVIARVYGEDNEPHVYKRGTYSTSRKNGRDLLTIEYEDGNISHLYYEIHGRTGEFVNVDTGQSDHYALHS